MAVPKRPSWPPEFRLLAKVAAVEMPRPHLDGDARGLNLMLMKSVATTSGAVQVFVINLAAAGDRLAWMQSQIQQGFQRIEAVRGADVPAHYACEFLPSAGLGDAEVGCYASHMLAAEQIVVRGLGYAVILEDDVAIDPDAFEIAERAARRLHQWDVIALSGAKQHPHNVISRLSTKHSLVRYLHFPKTTAAYVLSASGSRKLLRSRLRKRPIDVDIRYGWEMGFENYGVFPPPARQSGLFPSSIPKSPRRYYWRSNPIGYALGRVSTARRLGVLNMIRALAMR